RQHGVDLQRTIKSQYQGGGEYVLPIAPARQVNALRLSAQNPRPGTLAIPLSPASTRILMQVDSKLGHDLRSSERRIRYGSRSATTDCSTFFSFYTRARSRGTAILKQFLGSSSSAIPPCHPAVRNRSRAAQSDPSTMGARLWLTSHDSAASSRGRTVPDTAALTLDSAFQSPAVTTGDTTSG